MKIKKANEKLRETFELSERILNQPIFENLNALDPVNLVAPPTFVSEGVKDFVSRDLNPTI